MDLSPREQIHAVLFDMDGTLILSEDRTDQAMASLLAAHAIAPDPMTMERAHGVTWAESAERLVEAWPILRELEIIPALQGHFHASLVENPPPRVPGARQAIRAAASVVPTGIVTSSNRETLDLVCRQLDLGGVVSTTIAAEDYTHSKPSPEPYLLAARRLGVAPGRCLVFEDSAAGIQAALAAGATVIAVGAPAGQLRWITDYHQLPPDFFASASGRTHSRRGCRS